MMDVEIGENNGEKEKDRMTAKEEPMEAEPTKKETEEAAGTSVKEDASEPAVGGLSAEVKKEPGVEEDDDDPVIHEIPVYLSKGIPKLYLFQVCSVAFIDTWPAKSE